MKGKCRCNTAPLESFSQLAFPIGAETAFRLECASHGGGRVLFLRADGHGHASAIGDVEWFLLWSQRFKPHVSARVKIRLAEPSPEAAPQVFWLQRRAVSAQPWERWGRPPKSDQAVQSWCLAQLLEPAAITAMYRFKSGGAPPEESTMFTAKPTLVLNADLQPLNYCPLSLFNWEDAEGRGEGISRRRRRIQPGRAQLDHHHAAAIDHRAPRIRATVGSSCLHEVQHLPP